MKGATAVAGGAGSLVDAARMVALAMTALSFEFARVGELRRCLPGPELIAVGRGRPRHTPLRFSSLVRFSPARVARRQGEAIRRRLAAQRGHGGGPERGAPLFERLLVKLLLPRLV